MSRSQTPQRSRSRSPDDSKRDLKGRVVTLHSENGFGFIELHGDDSRDHIFFHSEHIIDDIDIRQFREGDEVLCDLTPSKKKQGRYDGVNIRPVDTETKNRRSDPGKRLRRGRRDRSRSPRRRGFNDRRRRSPSYDRRRRSPSRDRGRRRDRSYDSYDEGRRY